MHPPSILKWSALLAPLFSLVEMGCSVAATPEAPDAEATSAAATALVAIERTTGPGDTLRADSVVARFVRVHQGNVDSQALRLAGVASDLPALGTCSPTASVRGERDVGSGAPPRSIDLLDVGALTLGERDSVSSPGGKPTELVARTMFDPSGGVSGVFYSARSSDMFAPASRVRLQTSGGPDLAEGFSVDVAAPREVADVRAFLGRSHLDVSWDASDADERDTVYVDVVSSGRLVTRCTTTDAGHLVITGPAVAPLQEGSVAVHRLHRESFRTKGIDPGEVRFDVARVVIFHR